jgi:hypothetical protein
VSFIQQSHIAKKQWSYMVPSWWQLPKHHDALVNLQVDILHHPSTDEGALDVFVKIFTGDPGM